MQHQFAFCEVIYPCVIENTIALTISQSELEDISANLQRANDFEKVELDERADGLKFAKACLDTAWQRRKEVLL